jgi:hypothetical protein
LILLTDGIQTGVEVAAVRAHAAALKASGAILVTIGLGDGVDEALLREIATSSAHYHFAPTADDLELIYRGLTVSIPCPTAPVPSNPSPGASPSPTYTPTGVATGRIDPELAIYLPLLARR